MYVAGTRNSECPVIKRERGVLTFQKSTAYVDKQFLFSSKGVLLFILYKKRTMYVDVHIYYVSAAGQLLGKSVVGLFSDQQCQKSKGNII